MIKKTLSFLLASLATSVVFADNCQTCPDIATVKAALISIPVSSIPAGATWHATSKNSITVGNCQWGPVEALMSTPLSLLPTGFDPLKNAQTAQQNITSSFFVNVQTKYICTYRIANPQYNDPSKTAVGIYLNHFPSN